MTSTVHQVKKIVKTLLCLETPDPNASLIVETNASELGYGGILK